MKFNFTGIIKANDINAEKYPLVRKGKTKRGDSYQSLNVSVNVDGNSASLELFSMKNDTIKTKNKDGEDVEVDWADRKDPDVVKDVASYRKLVYVDADNNRHEFISPYDFVDYVVAHIDDIKGKKHTVVGTTFKNFYKGKTSDKFQISKIYCAPSDRKNALTISTTLYLTKDSVDTSDWKEDKKIVINGWTQEWLNKKDTGLENSGNYYMPITVIFDCSRVNFENDNHIKQMQFRLKQLGLEYKDGKIVNNIKAKKVLSNAVSLKYLNGAEKKEFDESQLTDLQKEKIELGLAELDDFRPAGDIYGEKVTEYRLSDIPLTGDFSDGFVYLDESISEFEDEIFEYAEDEEISEDEFEEEVEEEEKPKKNSKKEDTEEESEDDSDDEEEDDDDLEDLF